MASPFGTPKIVDPSSSPKKQSEPFTQDVKDICPFLGMVVMLTGRVRAPSISHPEVPPIPEQLPIGTPCIRDQCVFWQAGTVNRTLGEQAGCCAILAAMLALPEISAKLDPLGGIFGAKR
jgi:hypothetical protein